MTNQTINKSFILHNDSLEILDKLDDAQAGKLFKAIKFYQKHKQLPQLDFTLDLVFTPFLNQFKRDEEKYKNIIERNKINGSKGGRPKNPVGYLETQENPRKPKKAYSDSKDKNDSKNDSDNDNKNDSKPKFTPPTLQEVKDYFIEKGYQSNPKTYFDYYEANGWKDRDNKQVKNWKQKAITWNSKNNELPLPSNVIEINKIAGDLVIKEIKEYPLEIDLVCVAGGAEKMRALPEDKRQAIKQKFNNKKINLV